ncbi:MAG TPA: zinc ribbon domain-containing protein [Gemmatimonadales bacterium]|nr:zinc ribbon domain-containing protein [Gemmatimonadales bacterium]
MNLMEAIAAGLVGLAVVAFLLGPLSRGAVAATGGSEDPEDPEDTPRGVALAALREIEFDRATGKLSDEDYAALKRKYTAEAIAVLRSTDGSMNDTDGFTDDTDSTDDDTDASVQSSVQSVSSVDPSVDPIEARIADRVRQLQGAGAVKCPSCGPRPEGDALFCSSCGQSLTTGGCAGCGAPLVPGSRFCEQGGVTIAR